MDVLDPWAALADVYTPALALAVVLAFFRKAGRAPARRAGELAIRVGVVYALMLLDMALGLWPALGLDYSTHTALSLALVMQLSTMRPGMRTGLTASLLLYCALMYWLGYHSPADMLTTAGAVAGVMALGLAALNRLLPRESPPAGEESGDRT